MSGLGPREQRSPKSLLHHPNPCLHRCNPISHQCKRPLARGVQKDLLHPLLATFGNFHCDPSDHLQESPGPPGLKSQKSLKKSLFRGLQKSPRKCPKKSKNTQNWTFSGVFRLFRVFSGTFLQTPQKTLFETFLGFRARRARRLL